MAPTAPNCAKYDKDQTLKTTIGVLNNNHSFFVLIRLNSDDKLIVSEFLSHNIRLYEFPLKL